MTVKQDIQLSDFRVSDWLPEKDLGGGWSIVRKGSGTVLLFKGEWWMDDYMLGRGFDNTFDFIDKAKGHILITGLGLGCVPAYLINKKNDAIESITIIEREPRIIRHVGTELIKKSDKISIVEADAMSWIPTRIFDVAWHDFFLSSPRENEVSFTEKHYEKYCREQYFWRDREK